MENATPVPRGSPSRVNRALFGEDSPLSTRINPLNRDEFPPWQELGELAHALPLSKSKCKGCADGTRFKSGGYPRGGVSGGWKTRYLNESWRGIGEKMGIERSKSARN